MGSSLTSSTGAHAIAHVWGSWYSEDHLAQLPLTQERYETTPMSQQQWWEQLLLLLRWWAYVCLDAIAAVINAVMISWDAAAAWTPIEPTTLGDDCKKTKNNDCLLHFVVFFVFVLLKLEDWLMIIWRIEGLLYEFWSASLEIRLEIEKKEFVFLRKGCC